MPHHICNQYTNNLFTTHLHQGGIPALCHRKPRSQRQRETVSSNEYSLHRPSDPGSDRRSWAQGSRPLTSSWQSIERRVVLRDGNELSLFPSTFLRDSLPSGGKWRTGRRSKMPPSFLLLSPPSLVTLFRSFSLSNIFNVCWGVWVRVRMEQTCSRHEFAQRDPGTWETRDRPACRKWICKQQTVSSNSENCCWTS